jgi:hypothetical protein
MPGLPGLIYDPEIVLGMLGYAVGVSYVVYEPSGNSI